ncbi:MAG: hypothetical protein JWP89_4300 [Schlesneria sp.]|nr:hypothetical protein [Schlesneria sp.]
MDAFFRSLLLLGAVVSLGAGYRTPNFVVTAPSADLAKQVGDAAEIYRKELAIEWIGKPLPGNWSTPCPIDVNPGMMGAGGATTFNFQNGEVYGWKMEIFGSEERILDSVLPHEINHTIFASYFRRPLPRWADEGAASLIENECERMRLRKIHDQVMNTTRKIPLASLLEMKNYPKEKQQVLTLYAEGHSLADFLIQRGDKPTYLKFLQLAHDKGWPIALKEIYQFDSVDALERVWDKWVLAGSQPLQLPKGTQLADNKASKGPAKSKETIRGQSPDAEPSVPRIQREEVLAANITEGITVDAGLSREYLEQPVLTQLARSGAARVSHDRPARPAPLE